MGKITRLDEMPLALASPDNCYGRTMPVVSNTTRTRRTREELRALVVDAGCQVLLSLQPTLAFEQLTYGAVFGHLKEAQGIRVTHASVHERIWPNQKAFQLEVLRTTLDRLPGESLMRYLDPLQRAMEQAALTTLAGRRRAAQEFMRVGQNANWQALALDEANSLRIYHMLRVSLATFGPEQDVDPERQELIDLMVQLRTTSLESYIALMKGMCDLIGLRPRPIYGDSELAFVQLARSANATAIGFVLDELGSTDEMLHLPSGPDGELEEWRPVSIALWNLLRGGFELADEGLEPAERRL